MQIAVDEKSGTVEEVLSGKRKSTWWSSHAGQNIFIEKIKVIRFKPDNLFIDWKKRVSPKTSQ